jgi:hypothetical protein
MDMDGWPGRSKGTLGRGGVGRADKGDPEAEGLGFPVPHQG